MELKRPDWIKVKAPNSKEYENTKFIQEKTLGTKNAKDRNAASRAALCKNIIRSRISIRQTIVYLY